ncbi:MAG: hypothetical protein H8M99_16010 [Gloeobacteraceae cyanobacterium ES-bin-144]|nr:hypothetical protein [Verrucomicrobiales bacterium]
MADFVPATDGDFNTFSTNLGTYVNANLADFGLVAGDVAVLNAAQTGWDSAYPLVAPAVAAASAATQAKTTARDTLTAALRALVKLIQAKPAVTAESKQAIGITIADTTKTPVAVPTTAPVGRIEQPNRLEHNVHFADATTPTSKAKPAGVRGCQIWVKIGTTPPASVSELNYLATDTRTPYVAQFDAADAGKTAYYWLRWENTKGETGPWSAVVSATITG